MKTLDKLLKDNGIKPAKADLDDMFNSPLNQLDDLFNNVFPAIFKDYNKNKKL